MKRALAVSALASCLCALAPRASANPMDMYGLGSRSAAMGGAVTADVSDFSANYYNPAGVVRSGAAQLALGYMYAWNQLSTNGNDNHVDPVHGLYTGIIAPTHLFGMPLAFGLALFVPDERLAASRLLTESQPRWELYDNRVQRLYFAANLAIEPIHGVRIGAGFAYMAGVVGVVGLHGEIPTSGNAQLFHTLNADVLAVYYPQAGIQVDVLPTLTLGLTYRGEYRFRLDLDANLDLDIVVGRLSDPNAVRAHGDIYLQERAVTQFLPQQAVLGAAWRPIPSITIAADLTWVNWSAYINPTANINVGVQFEMPPGSENIPRPNIPPAMVPHAANFHDTFVPRIGIEWRHDLPAASTLALRAGYRFDASPVPDQTGPTNFLDSNRHDVSLGAGIRFRNTGPTRASSTAIDLHGDMQFLESRTMLKTDPADPVGDYSIGGYVVSLSAMVSTTF